MECTRIHALVQRLKKNGLGATSVLVRAYDKCVHGRNKLSLTVSIQHFSISCEGSSDIQRPQNSLIPFVSQALLQKWLELSEIHC